MQTLSIREMRGALTRLDELLRHRHEVLITRRGKAIARLLPMDAPRRAPSRRLLREMTSTMAVASEELVREDRDGR